MTRLPDVINSKINKYAGAMEALAKGDEMTDELKPCPFCGNTTSDHGHKDECWFHVIYKSKQERENAWQVRPLEDALRAQLAARDALMERLVEAGDDFAGAYRGTKYWEQTYEKHLSLVAEWKASKDGGAE